MRLEELFTPGSSRILPWKMIGTNSHTVGYVFDAEDVGKYYVNFHEDDEDTWVMDFVLYPKNRSNDPDHVGGTHDIVDTGGHQVSVMATVIDIFRDFISHKPNVKVVEFSAKEPSRQRLYRRFAKMIDPKFTERGRDYDHQIVFRMKIR